MNKNIIITIIAILVIITGFVIFAGNSPNANQAAEENQILVVEEPTFDFGVISMAAGNVTYNYKIKNSGTEPITITKMYTSCMCTTATFIKGAERTGPFGMPGHTPLPKINKILAAGEEATIEVVFDPAAHGPAGIGRVERIVYLENDAGADLQLKFTATVTP